MKLAWKTLLPLALINLFMVGLKTVFLPDLSLWVSVPVYIVITVILIPSWARFMRPGRQTIGT